MLDASRLLGRRRREYCFDAFAFGVADETACIDHHGVGIGAFAVEHHSYPAAASRAIRCSLSTVFFEHPRVMTLIFFICYIIRMASSYRLGRQF